MKNKTGVGWCLIPPEIVSRVDLSPNEKIVAGRINGLCVKHGYCYASNRWLSKQLNLSSGTTSNIISSLVMKGLLRREVIRGKDNRIIYRKLYTLSMQQWIPNNARIDEEGREKSIRVNVDNDHFSKLKSDEYQEVHTVKKHIKENPSVNPEVNKAILYYLNRYRAIFRKPHPKISFTQYQMVKQGFENPAWVSSNDFSDKDYQSIIDDWFRDENVDSDYNIIHFASGDVISYHAMKQNLIDEEDIPWPE